jgi:DNA-binding NarL/FixJ family response regulator
VVSGEHDDAPRTFQSPHVGRQAFVNNVSTNRAGLEREDVALLRLLSEGLPVESVARRLDLSDRTVRRRTRSICDRLGFHAPVQAIVWAARRGLL